MSIAGVRFGLEGEYLLAEAATFRPLWHPDVSFHRLNAILEAIPYESLLQGLSLDGLELDPPHRRLLPYYVEGYGLPDAELTAWVDLLPKGIEIRTPVCPTLEACLAVYEDLYQGLQRALGEAGYRAIALAHHPEAWSFRGPQNHRRTDWWQWGMQAMTTYGPDLNLSLPEDRRRHLDWDDLLQRVNYYTPALVAFSLAAPVARGRPWEIRGQPGLSLRTYRRSLYAPAVAYHPKEQGRLEFKAFDMPADRNEFRRYFLLWLWLLLDEAAPGRADDQDLVYDLSAVARLGWEAEDVAARAAEALDRASTLLAAIDVDPSPLDALRRRHERRLTPAHALLLQLKADPSVPHLLHFIDQAAREPHASAAAWSWAGSEENGAAGLTLAAGAAP